MRGPALLGLALAGLLLCRPVANAQLAPLPRAGLLAQFCSEGGAAVPDAVRQLLATVADAPAAERSWALRVVQGFAARRLRCADDGAAFLVTGAAALDAATLAPAILPDGARAPLPSLRSRALLEQLAAALTLFVAPDAADRVNAAHGLERRSDGLPPGLAQKALEDERDPGVRASLLGLIVAAGLHAPDIGQRLAAIAALGADPGARVVAQLAGLRTDAAFSADSRIGAALDAALAHARFWVSVGDWLSLAYDGLSVGSVLFLSAVGLAIIFGLMGVINLAQGELIMIGAYATYGVQQGMRAWTPGLVDWYPLVAVPVVFVVTALVGVLMEVLVIQHLYRRPLMTLLATWAISLLLINLVRVGFGTQNLQFLTPPYLTGGIRVVGDFLITWNHLGAICCAVIAFGGTLTLLRATDLGLFIRTVTQNRDMAGCIGISTRRIDMAAFALGGGLAGLGGLALSPIYNVNPTMGTGFIIDSFMVVVLGGVGSLFGTAAAALGIGLVDVGIEPFYGAVAAKVIVLLMIVALIQWRPEGLVARKGRR